MSEPSNAVLYDDTEFEHGAVSPRDVQRAVVTSTDWTAETILSQMRRGNIQLNPRFQRRDAWTATRKSLFIESLILGLPIPQIVLAESRDRRGSFIVLDGKQRLLALRQFAAEKQDEFTPLKLVDLEVRHDLEGYDLASLEADSSKHDAIDAFSNQTIRTVVVRAWPDEAFLDLVFLRLNTGSVQLSPQELRQALRPGPFTDFTDSFSAGSSALQRALRIGEPDFRMRDVEVLLRYFGFRYFLEDYRGVLKSFLDDTLERLNDRWRRDELQLREAAAECDEAIDIVFKVFGKDSFFRYDSIKERYERRFNRAVFDVLTWYLAQGNDVGPAMREAGPALKEAFEELCGNSEFHDSITRTTKSVGATFTRLSLWGAVLRRVCALDVPVIELDQNRLVISRG